MVIQVITADTDDQIDIKIAGADDFKFTANDFLRPHLVVR